jgi:membrane protease YdiL (CAAX protease family)
VDRPPLWPVLVAYLLAFVAIVAFSIVAGDVVRGLHPDLGEAEALTGLPALLAGGIASSTALATTLLIVARPLEAARLRLRPGRETGTDLAVMVAGTLALGQALDSLTVLAGLGDRGAMAVIRAALQGAVGLELFAAVIVIGLMAGTAEEAFFRGYVQTSLVARWPPAVAVPLTSAAFAILHLEWLHVLLALALGLWLGFITERSGSALPAGTAHVVNNVVFTVVTATVGTVGGFWPNVGLAAAGAVLFAGALAWVSRRLPSAGAGTLRPLGGQR